MDTYGPIPHKAPPIVQTARTSRLLIAAQLEKSWESTLRRVEACQARLDAKCASAQEGIAAPDFTGLAEDLEAAWNAPGVTMRARQQLVRALTTDIVADVDEKRREIILTTHW